MKTYNEEQLLLANTHLVFDPAFGNFFNKLYSIGLYKKFFIKLKNQKVKLAYLKYCEMKLFIEELLFVPTFPKQGCQKNIYIF